jgi:hypothetical protein
MFDSESSTKLSNLQVKLDGAIAEVATIEQKIDRVVSAIELGGALEALTASLQRLEQEKAGVLARKEQIEKSLVVEQRRVRSVSNHRQVVDAILSLEDEEKHIILRDFLRSLIDRIDLLFDTQQLNIRYSLKEFERKTVIVFKGGESAVFLEDELLDGEM